MPRLNFNVDEATLLKAYKISSLNPTKWEEVDHDFDESIANATTMLAPSAAGNTSDKQREDLLGLGPAKSVKDLDMETKSSLLLSSRTFSPAQYLAFAHPNATYHDLSRGVAHLQKSIESREEALRVLVEEGFDRFVVVKGAVDGLYEDMKQGILSPETEHGTQPLRNLLKDGARKANQIFLPALETVSKADKLRTTLSVFERSRFFFNLPSFIMESIDAGKFDLALRDYKKGKYLLENRPGQLLPISSSTGSSSGTSSSAYPTGTASETHLKQMQAQQKRILNKVWASVEKAMGEMRKVLIVQLQDSSRSIEDHERTLETLLELQTGAISNAEDLIWTYFDNHHLHIMDKMNSTHRTGMKMITGKLTALQGMKSTGSSHAEKTSAITNSLVSQLRLAMMSLDAGDSDRDIARLASRSEPVWSAILNLVKSVSEVVSTSLPSFWKVGKDFLEGRFTKPSTDKASSRRSPRQCRTMVYDIVKLYISLISQAFMLSDVAVMSRSQSSQLLTGGPESKNYHSKNYQGAAPYQSPAIFPHESASLSTAFYLQNILGEVVECAGDLIGLDLDAPGSAEVKNGLKSLIESLKWRSIDFLGNEWIRDAGLFYHLEVWVASSTTNVDSKSKRSIIPTQHLEQFERFQRYMTTASYKIASTTNSEFFPSSSSAAAKAAISPLGRQAQAKVVLPQMLVGKVTRAFVDASYKFLDGLMLLASDDAPVARGDFEQVTAIAGSEMSLSQLFDLRDGNIRLLLVMANMDCFKKVFIPGMIIQLEKAFNVSMTEDRAALGNAVDQQDQVLFEAYIKPRARVIKEEMSKALLPGGDIDWYRTPQPVALRPYVSEIMNYLVEIHSQVCNVAPSLLDRVVIALIDELNKLVMELTFIHKSLANYGRDTSAGKRLEEIYTKEATQAYAPSAREDKDFQKAFDEMQETLANARRSTGVQFLCFRKMKEKEKLKESDDRELSRKDKHAGRMRVPRNK
ncbi:Exocyst complex component SEC5A [Psilocybe cubensis]|uniref:Exocyst complex component SEC5A n=1 Tax=Psilocybe cubensis TaxID=181762 RepID=A0ACB8GPW4_PSICU|nr:Exocyst complex component SEC5A [Psilocybe cubensis]KAH9477696.1 Exocyst complex component SEC5A [Psilocybe cubensis]